MMVFLTMVAAVLAAPEQIDRTGLEQPGVPATNPATWVRNREYPARAKQERREGTTEFLLTYDASGQVQQCEITSSSGHFDLDTATCEQITLRASFVPGKNAEGQQVGGTYSNRVRWRIPAVEPRPLPFSKPGQMTIDFIVDARGAVTTCTGRFDRPDVPATDGAVPMVDPCNEIRLGAPYSPARDKDGKALSQRYRVNMEVVIDDIAS